MLSEYSDLEVVTQTWVVYSNLLIDNQRLFDAIECAPLQQKLKKFQQRMQVDEKETLENGEIVFSEYLGAVKGQPFRKPKDKQMRNCATIIMKIDSGNGAQVKFYNIKISRKGNFQITGCTSKLPVILILEKIWELLMRLPGTWSFQKQFDSNNFICYLCCQMHNVRFLLPHKIDLRKLNNSVKSFLGETTIDDLVEYSSIYEPSIGYGGVNIKIKSDKQQIKDVEITKAEFVEGRFHFSEVMFGEYAKYLPKKDKDKKLNKISQNSFLVFHSGKAIMSGTFSAENRRDSYEKFKKLVFEYGKHFL
jgi:hypothetical protein